MILSEDEIERAERYHFQEHCRQFILTHGVLRHILARYLQVRGENINPKAIQFRYGRFGKPEIGGKDNQPPNDAAITFNTSRSRDTAVYAISLDCKVGIDVEYVRPISEIDGIISTHFSDFEKQWLKTVTPDERLAAFYNCWCRKEALLKAIGSGLSEPLNRFSVISESGDNVRFVQAKEEPWELIDLNISDGYCAALAVQSGFDKITCFEWIKQYDKL